MGKYRELLADPTKLQASIQEIFDQFDTDKSGYIEPKELKTALSDFYVKLGIKEKISDDDYLRILEQYDENKDQKLSTEEFQKLGRTAIELLAKAEKD